MPKNEFIKLVDREQILSSMRVASVFADKTAGDGERFVDDGKLLDKSREAVVLENTPVGAEEGCVYYEQFQAQSCWIKLG